MGNKQHKGKCQGTGVREGSLRMMCTARHMQTQRREVKNQGFAGTYILERAYWEFMWET